MANNILSAIIDVKAPGVEATAKKVSSAIDTTAVSFTKLDKSVKTFGSGVFAAVPRTLDNVSKSLTKTTTASSQATFALTNLGRVAQDAPYGFIGIANNLNPLLESFQRLKATTGTTKGALKELGKSLTGVGGVGLALSVVSSLLVVFGDKLFGSKKKAEEAATSADKLKSAIEGIFGAAAKEAAEVSGFIAILKSETETRQRKLEAIKELQRIQPEVFSSIRQEGDAIIGLDAAYKSYLDNLKTVISAKIVQAKLEELITKQLKLQGVAQTETVKGLFKALEIFNDSRLKNAQKDPSQQSNIIEQIVGSKEARQKELDQLQRDIDGALKELVGFSQGIKTTALKDAKIKLPKDFIAPFPKLSKLTYPVEASIDIERIQYNLLNVGGKKYKSFAELVADENTKRIESLVVKPNIVLSPNVLLDQQKLNDIRLLAEDTAKAFNDSLQRTLSGGFAAIGEGIGAIFSGGDIDKAFAGFANVLASGLQALGEQIIAIGVAAILAKEALKTLFTNPAIAIAAGVALVAAGAALKNALGGGIKGARAVGGPVTGGSPYLVGERGAEVFVPNTGGRIIPNNRIGTAAGSGGFGNATLTLQFDRRNMVQSFRLEELFQRRNA